MHAVRLLTAFLLLASPMAAQADLTVVSTAPKTGARGVDPGLKQIRIRFSAPVRTTGWSIVNSDQGRPPEIIGTPAFEEGGRVCVLRVKLQPGTSYAFSVNSDRHRNFRSAQNPNVTVVPYPVTFTTAGQGPITKSPAQRWREDLACLAATLPAVHKNLFFHLPEEQFRQQVADLEARIPSLTEDQVAVELLKLVASVGDAHTRVAMWEPLAAKPIALRFHWFRDGIFLISAVGPTAPLLGSRLEAVGGTDIETVCQRLGAVVPHENEAQLKEAIPELLRFPRLLAALGLVAGPEEMPLRLVTQDEKEVDLPYRPGGSVETGRVVRVTDALRASPPIYLSNPSAPYWVRYLSDTDTIYLQYNECADAPGYPVADLRADLEKLLQEHGAARLVMDLRLNAGGDSSLLDPTIDVLAAMPHFQTKGSLFVIVGRRTFSSGLLNAAALQEKAKAIVVGEPTGGKPNHYGEVRGFTLPNSGLQVNYSTKFFRILEEDPPSLVPDLAAEESYADFAAGTDRALEAILKYPPRAE